MKQHIKEQKDLYLFECKIGKEKCRYSKTYYCEEQGIAERVKDIIQRYDGLYRMGEATVYADTQGHTDNKTELLKSLDSVKKVGVARIILMKGILFKTAYKGGIRISWENTDATYDYIICSAYDARLQLKDLVGDSVEQPEIAEHLAIERGKTGKDLQPLPVNESTTALIWLVAYTGMSVHIGCNDLAREHSGLRFQDTYTQDEYQLSLRKYEEQAV